MAKKAHDKPVGLDGSLRHRVGDGIDERTFNRHVAPKPKDLIEADIAGAFARLASEMHGTPLTLSQLSENDLDFMAEQDGREAKIEFTELVLTHPPYREEGQAAVIHYKPWAEKFYALVDKKNGKQYRESMPIDLLVYTTHFAYHGNDDCVALASERLRHLAGGANFDRIYYLDFTGAASQLYQLKPYSAPMSASVRRSLEERWHSLMNLSAGTAVPGGTKFDLKLPDKG